MVAFGLSGIALELHTGWMKLIVIVGMLFAIWGWLIQSPHRGKWSN